MAEVKAINPKHQVAVSKFIMWNDRYSQIVDQTDDNGGRRQENAYIKASDFFSRLPAREKANIGKVVDITGY